MNKNKKNTPENEEEQELDEIVENEAASDSDKKTESNIPAEDDFIESLKQENQKLKDDYLRAYAELENTKKRCAQELEKNSKYAVSSFAKELLSVADNLHRALDAAQQSNTDCDGLRKGVELTEAELMKAFAKYGIKKMEILGQVFDPNFHQVIQEIEDPEKPAGTIISELQTGYMINDRILREAMVVVTKGAKN